MHNPWPLVSNAKDTEEAGASPPSLGRSLTPGLLCPGLLSPYSLVSQPRPAQAFSPELLCPQDSSPAGGGGEGSWDSTFSAAWTPVFLLPGPLRPRCLLQVPCPISAPPPRLGPAGFLMRRALVSVRGSPTQKQEPQNLGFITADTPLPIPQKFTAREF